MNNLKQELLYEITKNERTYKFYLPMNAPLGEMYDIVYGLLGEIVQEANRLSEAAKQVQSTPEAPVETAPVETAPVETEVEIVKE